MTQSVESIKKDAETRMAKSVDRCYRLIRSCDRQILPEALGYHTVLIMARIVLRMSLATCGRQDLAREPTRPTAHKRWAQRR